MGGPDGAPRRVGAPWALWDCKRCCGLRRGAVATAKAHAEGPQRGTRHFKPTAGASPCHHAAIAREGERMRRARAQLQHLHHGLQGARRTRGTGSGGQAQAQGSRLEVLGCFGFSREGGVNNRVTRQGKGRGQGGLSCEQHLWAGQRPEYAGRGATTRAHRATAGQAVPANRERVYAAGRHQQPRRLAQPLEPMEA